MTPIIDWLVAKYWFFMDLLVTARNFFNCDNRRLFPHIVKSCHEWYIIFFHCNLSNAQEYLMPCFYITVLTLSKVKV